MTVAEYPEQGWRGRSGGEHIAPVIAAIVVAIALQLFLPEDLAPHLRWVLPALEVALVIVLGVVQPSMRISAHVPVVRGVAIALIAVISIANAVSAGRLILGLIDGSLDQDPAELLVTGGAIWATNVIVFALWYWDLDDGGPGRRAEGALAHPQVVYPDFVFPQMTSKDLAPPGWEPQFTDYLYLSFTNAAAFSPTDVMPYARWAKVAMMAQSMVSLATVVLVVARAVNILH